MKVFLVILLAFGWVFFATLYVLGISSYWSISPDGVTYVMPARVLAGLSPGSEHFADRVYSYLFSLGFFRPPVSSLLYAFAFMFGRTDYYFHNALVAAFALMSSLACVAVFKRTCGLVGSALISVLTLSSIYFYAESGRLLSDIFYAFFSLLTLAFLELSLSSSNRVRFSTLAGLSLVASTLTRVMGISLAFSVFITQSLCPRPNGEEPCWRSRLVFGVSSVAALLCFSMLELRNWIGSASYLGLFVQKERWVEYTQLVTLSDILRRTFSDLQVCLVETGRTLTNNGFGIGSPPAVGGSQVLLIAVLVLGLFLPSYKGPLPLRAYLLIYVVMVCAYLTGSRFGFRYLIPIVPLLFFFSWQGTLRAAAICSRLFKIKAASFCIGVLWLYSAAFLFSGARSILNVIPERQQSSFADSSIVWSNKPEVQQLTLWLKRNTKPETIIMGLHHDILSLLSERKCRSLPLYSDSTAILDKILLSDAEYLLVDSREKTNDKFIVPLVERHPEVFLPVEKRNTAGVYLINRTSS